MENKKELFVDLHIHSKYSRACSKDLTFPNLAKWAKVKGLNVLGTGDFTHPVWIKEIEKLRDGKNGFYYYEDFPFVITGEVSLIYKDDIKTRKVHIILLLPSLDVAKKINQYLDNRGLRRDYDGRPIFKITCEELVREMRKISKEIEVVPAHIWTPWFGIFGSKGGYDSLKSAFGKQEKHVHAIETGISSDIEMNSSVRELRTKSMLSFSDAHSFWPWRLGRECTIFKPFNTYKKMLKQIRDNSFVGTVEVNPAYGMYHIDGHRNCNFSCSPAETKALKGICPKCKKPLVIGVENRVAELAKLKSNGKSLWKVLPLHEIISLWCKKGISTKAVWRHYDILVDNFENEFDVLLYVSREKLLNFVPKELVDLIIKNRNSEIMVSPGFDGEYGKAIL